MSIDKYVIISSRYRKADITALHSERRKTKSEETKVSVQPLLAGGGGILKLQ